MTIKELEERTGLVRANIRFYESEGLISPKRLDNGYRDYSEEDAVTLEKIKLLRELHLDIDTIRLVQKGELTLEQALFSLLNRLEVDKAAIDRAVEVCRELEKSGVEYAALEPRPWLSKLEAPQYPRVVEPARPVTPEPEAVDYAHDHPWRRYLARLVDGWLCSLPVLAVYMLVLDRNPTKAGGLEDWFVGLLGLVLTLLCEPFWLRFWGWTPGKWLFGLKVRGPYGEKLTLEEGFFRVGGVFLSGYGLSIPLVNTWCHWKRWKECKEGAPAPWDEDTTYTYEPRRLDWLMGAGAIAALAGLVALLELLSYLPPNRGSLTEQEYYENINFYMEWMTESDWRLSETGQWYEETGTSTVWVLHDRPEIQAEVGDEGIRTVTLTADGSQVAQGEYLYQDDWIYQIALLALLAQEKIWPTGYNEWSALFEGQWGDFEAEHKGVHILQTVDHSGYTGVGQVLVAGNGVAQSYRKTVTITLIGSE